MLKVGVAVKDDSPLRRLLSSSVLYAITGVAQQSVGFLLIPVYTRHIPPSEYGVLELLMAFLSVTMICGTLGLTSAVNKVYHRDCDTPEERHAVVGTAVLTSLPMFVAVGGLLMILAGPIAGVLTGSVANRGLLRIAVASSICYSIFAMVIAGLRAEERVAAYCVVSAVQFALALALNLVLVLVAGLGVQGVLLGNLVANVSALAMAVLMTSRGGRIALSRRLVRPLFAFGIAVVPSMLSGWVMDVSDRLLLRLFRDLSEVAQYGVGYKFGYAVQTLVTWPFQLAWPAVAFGISNHEGHEQTYARVFTYLVLVLTVALLGLEGLSTSVLPLVVGREYTLACTVVPAIAAAYALNALQYCVSPGIHVAGRTRSLSAIGMMAAVSNLILGLIMIPWFGIAGAAWATVGAYALAFGGAFWLAQRSHPVRYEGARIARIVVPGVVAYGSIQVLSATATGVWLVVAQMGVLGAFVFLVLASGFMAPDETRYLTGLLRRYTVAERRGQGA